MSCRVTELEYWNLGVPLNAYKKFEAWYETQLDVCIKVLHLDLGGEYKDKEFVTHLKSWGTEQRFTVHDTLEHNSIVTGLILYKEPSTP